MAQTILKEFTYDGSKVVVEVARRDAQGRTIDTTYATNAELAEKVDKQFIQFPSVEVFLRIHVSDIHKFSADLGHFFNGYTGNTTTANYYYFDAANVKVILDRPITEEGYILVMFQMKRKNASIGNKIAGYKFTHQTNPVDSLIPATLRRTGFWKSSYFAAIENATIGRDVINTFKSEWAIPIGVTSFTLSGNICVCQTVKQHARISYSGLAINATGSSNKDFYGYERLAFAICKYEPTISAKRMLIGPKTVIKTALIKDKRGKIEGVKFTMR